MADAHVPADAIKTIKGPVTRASVYEAMNALPRQDLFGVTWDPKAKGPAASPRASNTFQYQTMAAGGEYKLIAPEPAEIVIR
jgi:hypothetical protein